MSKINIDTIQGILDAEGWNILSEEYHNLTSELIFECPYGHKVYDTWKHMREHLTCPVCARQANLSSLNIEPKKKGTHRILALDQASYVSGWSIFDDGQLIKYGTFETHKEDFIERCDEIKNWLIQMINLWRPDYIGLEDIQFQNESEGRAMGVTVFQALAQLQGILMDMCYELHIQFNLCPTNTWRHYCGVKGRSRTEKKRSMQLLAKQWYAVNASEDEADAIGIGKYTVSLYKPVEVVSWE